jgi:hypothetical protein
MQPCMKVSTLESHSMNVTYDRTPVTMLRYFVCAIDECQPERLGSWGQLRGHATPVRDVV